MDVAEKESEEVLRVAIKSRAYHADLLEASQKFGGIVALAAHLRISSATLSAWILLKKFPSLQTITKSGKKRINRKLSKKWPSIEKKLRALTGKSTRELFPEFVRLSGILEANKTATEIREVSAGTMLTYRDKAPLAIEYFDKTDSLESAVASVIDVVSAREKIVLSSYYGLNGTPAKSLEEIGLDLGVSSTRVKQIRDNALRNIGARSENLGSAFEAMDLEACPKCGHFVMSFLHCDDCRVVLCSDCMDLHKRSESHKENVKPKL